MSVEREIICEDCGSIFLRLQSYLQETWRMDPMFKWKSKKCDACVAKRVEKAITRLPEVLNSLAINR